MKFCAAPHFAANALMFSWHFAPTTGYGYDDVGRDTLEKIFAELFGTQAAIVRPQIASGTHAISLCLFGLVLPGDDIVSATGMPYDTLQDIIGWGEGDAPVGSLREMGVSFHPVALRGGKIDLDAVENAITPKTKLVIAQRSRGYDWRPSLMPEEFAPLAKMLHEKHPGVRLMVDNCYSEPGVGGGGGGGATTGRTCALAASLRIRAADLPPRAAISSARRRPSSASPTA